MTNFLSLWGKVIGFNFYKMPRLMSDYHAGIVLFTFSKFTSVRWAVGKGNALWILPRKVVALLQILQEVNAFFFTLRNLGHCFRKNIE